MIVVTLLLILVVNSISIQQGQGGVSEWKDFKLSRWNKIHPSLSDRVWAECKEEESSIHYVSHLLAGKEGGRCPPSETQCGKLFPVLLDLLSCPWVSHG